MSHPPNNKIQIYVVILCVKVNIQTGRFYAWYRCHRKYVYMMYFVIKEHQNITHTILIWRREIIKFLQLKQNLSGNKLRADCEVKASVLKWRITPVIFVTSRGTISFPRTPVMGFVMWCMLQKNFGPILFKRYSPDCVYYLLQTTNSIEICLLLCETRR